VFLCYFAFGAFIDLLIFGGVALGIHQGTNDLVAKMIHKAKKTKNTLAVAASQDPAWQEASLETYIRETFMKYQQDWSNGAYAQMHTYLTPNYYHHAALMMAALNQLGRRNETTGVVIESLQIVDADDEIDNAHDNFTAYISARAIDSLIDTATGEKLYVDVRPFSELWHFERSGSSWLLAGIEQTTANANKKIVAVQRFAERSNMHYSLDWGWLLLPKRGQLFSKSSFGKSDIDNHVIGVWQQTIVQLYTYQAMPDQSTPVYLIGQMTLPKSYGGIIVKRKSFLSSLAMAPSGYKKVSLEWADFNNRYAVYATNPEQVTAFELLNPSYMAKLYDSNLPIDIEVADNVVYFYTKSTLNRDETYPQMLDILAGAYKELRL
jgi:hypothetical protein